MIQRGSIVRFINNVDYRLDKTKTYTVETTINRETQGHIKLFYVCREDPESRICIVADEGDIIQK